MTIDQIEEHLNVHEIDRDKLLVHLLKLTVTNNAILKKLAANQALFMTQALDLRDGFGENTMEHISEMEAEKWAEIIQSM